MTTKKEEKTGIEKAREVANKIKADNAPKEIAKKANEQLKSETPKVFTGGTFGAFTIRKAERSQSKLRIGFAGPSGSGKTYSALLLAHGLAEWEEIAIIDTENGSADLYSHLGAYNVLTLEKPYHPDRYVEAIKAAEEAGMKVIIVDSITHEWSGEGGCLELQEKLGGRFQDWAKVTPLHKRFIQTILSAKAHVITTVRSKTDYSMSNEGGKSKVQKVGMKPETREGFEYEMTVSFDLNINNMAEISKDRTGLFKNDAPFVITEDTGRGLLAWTESGVDYIKKIRDLLKQKNKTDEPILTAFKVLSLEDLTPAMLKKTIAKLETLPDWTPAMQKEKEKQWKKEAEEKAKKEAEEKAAAEVQAKIEKENEIDLDEVDAGIEAQREADQK
jgi:hypothetical protein